MTEQVDVPEDAAQSLLSALTFGQCSPELASSYSRLATVLNEIGFTGHLDELDLLYSLVNDQNIDPTDVTLSVDEILRVSCERCFKEVGVEFDPNIPLAMLEDALTTILQFDPTDGPAVFVGMVDASDDSVEALLSLLAYVGNYDEDAWFPLILSVDENVIKRIREISANEDRRITEQPDLINVDELNKRLQRITQIAPNSLGAELARDNVGVGASLESLYGCHVGRLLDMSAEQATVELFSLAAISNESYEKLEHSISSALDDLCYEVDMRRRAEQVRMSMMKTYKPVFGIEHEKI